MSNENYLNILTDCHAQMADRVTLSVKLALDETDDVLFNLVKNTGSTGHSIYFEAMREIRRKRTTIEAGFRDRYIRNYETREKFDQSREIDASSGENADITLAVNNMISRIRRSGEPALVSLDKEIAALVHNAGLIKKELYPASPEIICTAFHEACAVIEVNVEVKLILFKVFEKLFADTAEEIYVDLLSIINKKMKSSNISQKQKIISNVQVQPLKNNHEQQNDRFILATGEVRKQINLHLGKAIVPDFIKDFLFNHWSKLLLKIYLRGGLESGNWLKASEVVDDLIKCIGSESSFAAKKEFSTKLPYLIQRLKNGMKAISISPSVQSDLVTRLVEYHKGLIKNETTRAAFDEAVTVPRYTTERKNVPFFNELLLDKK